MDEREVTELLVERIDKAIRDSGIVEEARKPLIDTLAVAAAAYRLSAAGTRIAGIAAGSSGHATILGAWRRAGLFEAVYVNSWLAHSLELDDWLAPAYVHTGAVVVPVALGLGEEQESSLADVLRAIVAGYEAGLVIGAYLGRSHYRDWHSTATAGSAAAATAAAILLGGDAAEAALSAVAALNYAGGLWALPRSTPALKPLSTALAALRGLGAALAVKGGEARGAEDVLRSACRRMGGSCTLQGTPEGPALHYNGYKFYPACRHTHTAIEAAERLHYYLDGVSPGEVTRVHVRVYEEARRIAGIRAPRSVEEARFSLSFLVALALVYGRVWLDTIEEGLEDKAVLELEKLVSIDADRVYSSAYPHEQPATVTIVVGGRQFSTEVRVPKGDPPRSPSLGELLGKARLLAETIRDGKLASIAVDAAKASVQTLVRDLLRP